jgi:hypothetical protein
MVRRLLRVTLAFFGAAGLLLVFGCGSRQAQPEFIFSVAQVERIEVSIDRGILGRASAVVRGNLRDSCTRIDSIKQSIEGHVFSLTLTTRRAIAAQECPDAEVPFEATVPLVVRGLHAGEYTVTSGSASATFFFTQAGATPEF